MSLSSENIKKTHLSFIEAMVALIFIYRLSGSCESDKYVHHVRIEPSELQVDTIGIDVRLKATAYDVNYDEIRRKSFSWSTDDSSVAIVDDDGLVSIIGPGNTFVRAHCENFTGASELQVCICFEEHYSDAAMINPVTNIISCTPYLNHAYEEGAMNIDEAIENGALVYSDEGYIESIQKKICN